MISRRDIIKKLTQNLQNNPHIHALWLEGADALNRVDEFSDIDFWLDVDDDQVENVMKDVENILEEMGELDFNINMRHPLRPVITQKMFHFKDSSRFLLIDVCIQQHSRDYKFNPDDPNENPKVLFDKGGVIKFAERDKIKLEQEMKDSIERIRQIFSQSVRVENKIRREQFLEAWGYYHKWILSKLVELIRIKYCPYKKDFYLKHAYYDLPQDVIKKLEDLHRVNTVEKIEEKMTVALQWGNKILGEYE